MAERLEAYRRLGAAVRSKLAYPASFGLQLAGQGLAQADLLAILVLFGRLACGGGRAAPATIEDLVRTLYAS